MNSVQFTRYAVQGDTSPLQRFLVGAFQAVPVDRPAVPGDTKFVQNPWYAMQSDTFAMQSDTIV
jgi:hypothetical protein